MTVSDQDLHKIYSLLLDGKFYEDYDEACRLVGVMREHLEENGQLKEDLAKAQNGYRCYSCKQVFEEDHGHGLAAERFDSALRGDLPKCPGCKGD